MTQSAMHVQPSSGGIVAHSDADLIHRMGQGELAAYGRLVTRYQGLVHSIARARLRQREAAEDLTQEVFLKAYLCLDQLGDPARFGAWVCALARNLATDWLRRGVVRSRFLQLVPMEEGAADMADPKQQNSAEANLAKLDREAVDRVLWSIAPDLREVILLHYEEDMSQADIARHLGVHPSTVGRRLEQALAALRRGVLHDIIQERAKSGVRIHVDGERTEAEIVRNLRDWTRTDQQAVRPTARASAARAMAIAVAVAALPEVGRAALLEGARETVRLVALPAAQAAASSGWFGGVAKAIGITPETSTAAAFTKIGLLLGSTATIGFTALVLAVSPTNPAAVLHWQMPQGISLFGSRPSLPPNIDGPIPVFKSGDQGQFDLPVGRSARLRPVTPMNGVKEIVIYRTEAGLSGLYCGLMGKDGNMDIVFGGFPAPTPGASRVPIVVDTIYGLFLMVEEVGADLRIHWSYRNEPSQLDIAEDLRQQYTLGKISIGEMRNRIVNAAIKNGYFAAFSPRDRALFEWAYRIRLGDQVPAPNLPIDVSTDFITSRTIREVSQ